MTVEKTERRQKKTQKKQSDIFLVISEILNIDGDSTSSRMK